MFVKAVEDEVGDGEVIFAPLELEILDAAVMKSDCMVGVDAINPGLGQIDHGLAGVDAVDLDGGGLGQKLREIKIYLFSKQRHRFLWNCLPDLYTCTYHMSYPYLLRQK